MTGPHRKLPDDCPCPWLRHADGGPFIRWPDPTCRHHGRPPSPRLGTVTPIRRNDAIR